nr:class F sortase [Jiangella mangrovi]
MPASAPALVEIDALGISQDVINLGLADDGTMEVPDGPDPVGWYELGPTPGESGPAVLAGQLTWNGADGVFRHLADLETGDEIRVTRDDGTVAVFAVTRVEQYAKDAFPTATVYANTAGPELRLITCAGDLDTGSGDYSDNVVAYAELIA